MDKNLELDKPQPIRRIPEIAMVQETSDKARDIRVQLANTFD